MAINDLTGQNIQDTFQKVIQTDGANIADGTGSLLPISFDGNNVIISGSLTATEYSVTSSVTNVIFQQQSGSTIFGDSLDDTHQITGSLVITGSGINLIGGNVGTSYKINGHEVVSRDEEGSSIIKFGNASFPVTMSANTLNINSAFAVTIDTNNGPVNFANNDNISIAFNTPEGHITASGNISSSGDIVAANISTPGFFTGDLAGNASSVTNGVLTVGDQTIGGDKTFSNPITASGDISSSGELIGIIDGGSF